MIDDIAARLEKARIRGQRERAQDALMTRISAVFEHADNFDALNVLQAQTVATILEIGRESEDAAKFLAEHYVNDMLTLLASAYAAQKPANLN
jgi:hypothetical protein